MPTTYMEPMYIGGELPQFDFGFSTGYTSPINTGFQFAPGLDPYVRNTAQQRTMMNPEFVGENTSLGTGSTPWWRNINMSKIGGIGVLAGGALSGLELYKNLDIDFNPSLTAESAKKLISTKGQQIARSINRQAVQTQGNVASQYEARGLGSSGKVIGDIAGVQQVAAGQKADVEADLNQQLLNALQYIDQRDLMIAQQEAANKQNFWGSLADLGLTAGGMMLL
jgi:hypothetical protein